MIDIKKSFRDGIMYSALGKYSNAIIQLIIIAILSRLMTPKQFGIVAIVNVFLIFFQILADSGIGPAIIQNKELTDHDIDNIFSITIYSGIFLSIFFSLLGFPISIVYENRIYLILCLLLGICVFFYTITIVPQAILTKSLKFKQVSLLTLLANFISGFFAVVFAFAGFGVYSLIFSNIIKAIGTFFLLYSQVSLKFHKKFDKSSFSKIFDFAKFQFSSNFINYFARNLDNLLIGSIFSSTALGYYDKAYQLSLYPNQILSQVLTPAIHPIMSNFSEDKKKIASVFLKISSIMIMIGIPISTFLYFNAKDVILIMFGEQWLPSVLAFKILSVSVWVQMANSFLSSFFQATNNAKILFRVGLLTSSINILAICIGVFWGKIETVAFALLISFTLVLIITVYSLKKVFNFNIFSYFKIIVLNIFCIIPYIIINIFFIKLHYSSLINVVFQFIILLFSWFIMLFVTGYYKQLNIINMR